MKNTPTSAISKYVIKLIIKNQVRWPFKCQPHEMVKHTQNNSLAAANKLSVFDHFVGLNLSYILQVNSMYVNGYVAFCLSGFLFLLHFDG